MGRERDALPIRLHCGVLSRVRGTQTETSSSCEVTEASSRVRGKQTSSFLKCSTESGSPAVLAEVQHGSQRRPLECSAFPSRARASARRGPARCERETFGMRRGRSRTSFCPSAVDALQKMYAGEISFAPRARCQLLLSLAVRSSELDLAVEISILASP